MSNHYIVVYSVQLYRLHTYPKDAYFVKIDNLGRFVLWTQHLGINYHIIE